MSVSKSELKKSIKDSGNIWDQISVVFGLGFLPKAPGTWGSLSGLPSAYAISALASYLTTNPTFQIFLQISALTIIAIIAWYAIKQTEHRWQCHDHSCIVVDELAGQAIASIFFCSNILDLILSFILFRLFDITKPNLIGYFDKKVHTPLGTLMDDIIAGIYAAVTLYTLTYFNITEILSSYFNKLPVFK